MRVKMLNSRVGVDVTFDGGSEYDLPEERALRWIESGFAVAVDGVPEPAVTLDAEPVEPESPADPVVQPVSKRGRRR